MYKILTNNESNNKTNNFNINNPNTLNTIDCLCTDGHHAYDKVSNHPLFKYNIKHHIISKSETCLVESLNSSMRDKLARLKRKTKAYSKSQYMLEISLRLWSNFKDIFKVV